MAIDLFCHSSLPLPRVKEALSPLLLQHQELFANKFLISDVMLSSDVDKEVALEHGLDAQCLFLIRVNDKSATGLLPTVVDIVKDALSDSNVVILFENEDRR
jgi:hypothetical protein